MNSSRPVSGPTLTLDWSCAYASEVADRTVVAALALAEPTTVLAAASAFPLISVITYYALALVTSMTALISLDSLIFALVNRL